MRMQIYEHIYDLSPPIFTHKMVNNLYFSLLGSGEFLAYRKKSRKSFLKRFEKLIHFAHTRPLGHCKTFAKFIKFVQHENFSFNLNRTLSRLDFVFSSAYTFISEVQWNLLLIYSLAFDSGWNLFRLNNATNDKTFDKLAERKDNLPRDYDSKRFWAETNLRYFLIEINWPRFTSYPRRTLIKLINWKFLIANKLLKQIDMKTKKLNRLIMIPFRLPVSLFFFSNNSHRSWQSDSFSIAWKALGKLKAIKLSINTVSNTLFNFHFAHRHPLLIIRIHSAAQ